MQNLAPINDSKDVTTKKYVDDQFLFGNFNSAPVLRTIEFDVSSVAQFEICRRANTSEANGTNGEKIIDNIAFRMTVTGENIYAVMDFICMWPGGLDYPMVIALNRTYNTASATTGIRYLYIRRPNVLGSEHPWLIDFAAYNTATRHIKIEVFQESDYVTWVTGRTPTSNNSSNMTSTTITLFTSRGISARGYFNFTATGATGAGYISTYLPRFTGGTLPTAGEALVANNLAFLSGSSFYKISTKTKPIEPLAGISHVGNNYNANAVIAYQHLRQKFSMTNLTANSGVVFDTMVYGQPVYLRCTLSNGNIYSDAYVTPTVAPGYTWFYLGVAQSASAIALDTCGGFFFTLDANGKLTHINGREILSGASEASVPASATISNSGLITFKNSSGADLFRLQLPLYSGGATVT